MNSRRLSSPAAGVDSEELNSNSYTDEAGFDSDIFVPKHFYEDRGPTDLRLRKPCTLAMVDDGERRKGRTKLEDAEWGYSANMEKFDCWSSSFVRRKVIRGDRQIGTKV